MRKKQSRYPVYKFEEDPLVLQTRGEFFDHYIDGLNEDERNQAAQMKTEPVLRKPWRDIVKGSDEYKKFLAEIRRKVPFMGMAYNGYRFENVAGLGGSGNSVYVGVRSLRKLQYEPLARMIKGNQVNIIGDLKNKFQSEDEMKRLYAHLLNLPDTSKKIAAKVLVETRAVHTICPQTLAGASVIEPTFEDVSPGMSRQEKVLERFLREGEILKNINHPNIVRVYDCKPCTRTITEGESVNMWFYTMEYLPRSSADTTIFPQADAVELAIKVAEAISVMHEHGVIHRDIKPANIMFNSNGILKVTDPGIAKRTSVSDFERTCLSITEQGKGVGTPDYMPPEQITDAKNVDGRADIYSLGATLYRWVSGHLPYEKKLSLMDTLEMIKNGEQIPLRTRLHKRNKALDWVVTKAIQRDPKNRFETMPEFLDALKGL